MRHFKMVTKKDKQEANTVTAKDSKNLEIHIPQMAQSESATSEKPATTVKISRLNTAAPEDSLNKISFLVEQTHITQEESERRRKEIEKKLDYLRGELNRSSAFLATTQKTITNINLMYHNDMVRLANKLDTGSGLIKSEEELDHHYEHIQEKVQNLRKRVQAYKQKQSEHDMSKNFEQTVTEIVDSFTDVENTAYKENDDSI